MIGARVRRGPRVDGVRDGRGFFLSEEVPGVELVSWVSVGWCGEVAAVAGKGLGLGCEILVDGCDLVQEEFRYGVAECLRGGDAVLCGGRV